MLSREALKRFVAVASSGRGCQGDVAGAAEDVEMGMCMRSAAVRPGESRDRLGRETFHPFEPADHLIAGVIPKDNWYWTYNYHPAREVGEKGDGGQGRFGRQGGGCCPQGREEGPAVWL